MIWIALGSLAAVTLAVIGIVWFVVREILDIMKRVL